MSALASGQKTQSMHDWVRTLRTESPPESMEDYLQSWEAFFDHYASQADYWDRRNAGYHNAIASPGPVLHTFRKQRARGRQW
jgi:hypothetical protein